ncbi:acyltransferase domain-containing protein [Amycolatopsis magusensis]|uniref:acyltransferase domain-containing protein n=1 Tax=Amycolatopsis magusensis TaxID=882444 RepID=UPI0024A89592|nr:acyltransferase domain-containing protein [Amycolatopsis magusensis]MDI5979859.1 acyltransferase domain-containing protein [Amycolatopsis magusensis]
MAPCAWIFAGPGAHIAGALGPLVDESVEFRALLADVDGVCGDFGWGPVSPLLLSGGDGAEHPQHLWLGFYVTSLVLAGMLTGSGVLAEVYVGHSSGEVTALVAAGALTAGDGARVLCERLKAVGTAGSPSGRMLAVNAGVRRVRHLCGAVGDRSLAVAVDNGPRQVVVSGRTEAIDLLRRAAEAIGVSAVVLDIPGAYHNPMFDAAAERFAEATAAISLRRPTTPVYSPQLGRYVRTRTEVRELLDGLLVRPVGFREALTTLYDEGIETFVECGARTVASALVAAVLPASVRTVSLLPDRSTAGRVRERAAALLPGAAVAGHHGEEAVAEAGPAPSAGEPVPVAAALPPRDDLVARVRQVYAEVLQYPVDVVEEEVDLEADLGVSSLKHTQVFVRLLDLFGLPTPGPEVRVFSFRTVGQVAGLLQQLAAQDGHGTG